MFSSSPRLIAAYRVFLRLPTPRHPPDALACFFSKKNFLPSLCNCERAASHEAAKLVLGSEQELHVPVAFKHGLPRMFDLVGLERLELSTSRLSGVRSNHLSYRPARLVFLLPAASRPPCPAVMYFCVHSPGQGSTSLPEPKNRRGRHATGGAGRV